MIFVLLCLYSESTKHVCEQKLDCVCHRTNADQFSNFSKKLACSVR